MVYHAVNVFGFNWWQVVFVAEALFWIILGQIKYRLGDDCCKIVERLSNKTLSWFNLIISVGFGICFTLESWRGLLQWIENGLIGDLVSWGVVLLPFAIIIIVIANAVIVWVIGQMSAWLKYTRLSAKIRKVKRDRMRKKDDLFARWSR